MACWGISSPQSFGTRHGFTVLSDRKLSRKRNNTTPTRTTTADDRDIEVRIPSGCTQGRERLVVRTIPMTRVLLYSCLWMWHDPVAADGSADSTGSFKWTATTRISLSVVRRSHSPFANPPLLWFRSKPSDTFVRPFKFLRVQESRSNATQMTLKHVHLSMSGKYSCEVSADAPSFHTALVTGEMEVVEVPKDQPVITGVRLRYKLGETLQGNCSSSWSKPAAKLSWFINGEPVREPGLCHTVTTG
uniref:Ig-like domain-containing protein n=1 Tax=Timema genevievae TaxID=629358 RepID=A0A7R9PJP1_TIMGE|nr:unnamed protein product [Timema genevievae]